MPIAGKFRLMSACLPVVLGLKFQVSSRFCVMTSASGENFNPYFLLLSKLRDKH